MLITYILFWVMIFFCLRTRITLIFILLKSKYPLIQLYHIKTSSIKFASNNFNSRKKYPQWKTIKLNQKS